MERQRNREYYRPQGLRARERQRERETESAREREIARKRSDCFRCLALWGERDDPVERRVRAG